MLKPLKMVFGMVLLVFCVALALEMLSPAEVFAQTVDTAWVRRYNGPGNVEDRAKAIVVDHSGNVYVTGMSYDSGTGEDYATIKYCPNGDIVWVSRYNGSGRNRSDNIQAMVVDDSGNVYVTGSSDIASLPYTVQYDYATIKYYPDGDTAWVRRYNGPGNDDDWAFAIAVDDSGNVYVTGRSAQNSIEPYNYDYATVKYKRNGDTAWVRRYNGPGNGNDWASAIAVDDSDNVYVTGGGYGSGTNFDYATIKYYPDGDTAWVRRYNGPGNSWDEAKALVIDDSGNVYVTGSIVGSGTYDDYATIKYKRNGDTAWVRTYNGPGNSEDMASAIAVNDSGNVYVTGGSYGSGTDGDYATIKYCPNGDIAWVRRYNGPGDFGDGARDIAVDDSGNVYVTGGSAQDSTGPYNYDYATIKYYPNGDTAWVIRYNGSGNADDWGCAIAVDHSNNIYVTGYSWGGGTDYDYATIKYVQKPSDVEDETESSEKPSEFFLSQNYPNPFNPATAIRFKVEGQRLKVSVHTTLKIYNVLGEVLRTLVNEEKLPGDYTVQWDGKNDEGEQLASGVYFYELKVEENTSAKKMMLLK